MSLVVVAGTRHDEAREVAEALDGVPVGDVADVARGTPRAVVILPAGVPLRSLVEVDEELWRRALDGNLTRAMEACRVAGPALAASGGGALVLVTHRVEGERGAAHLAAAAGAVGMLGRALAVELGGARVRVNALSVPVGHTLEAVPVLRLLTSDDGGYITGEVLELGGCTDVGAAAGRTEAGGLAGRVALVTGASRGIGAAIARRLAGEGAAVAVNAIDGPGAEAVAGSLRDGGADARAFVADVADAAAVETMVDGISGWRGPVEVLVNNAGVLEMAPLAEMDPRVWHRVVDVNLGGTFHCTRAVVRSMTEAGWGRIVNVASFWGLVGVGGATHYCASKGGIVAFTQAAAVELGPAGVRVSAIAPGTVDTEQLTADAAFAGLSLPEMREVYARDTLLDRIATTREIAALIVRLASDEGAPFHGSTLAATGGRKIA